jgi:hypothetical protein
MPLGFARKPLIEPSDSTSILNLIQTRESLGNAGVAIQREDGD